MFNKYKNFSYFLRGARAHLQIKQSSSPTLRFFSTISSHHHKISFTSDDLRSIAAQNNATDAFVKDNQVWEGHYEGDTVVLNSKYEDISGQKNEIGHFSYNKAEAYERNITVLVMQEYINALKEAGNFPSKGLNIFHAPEGFNIKPVRLLKEIDYSLVWRIIIADTNEACEEFMKVNGRANNLNYKQMAKLVVRRQSPRDELFRASPAVVKGAKQWHYQVIDLNAENGTSAYISQAMQGIGDEGLLCVTIKNSPELTGEAFEETFTQYGSLTSKKNLSPEQEIRIALHDINVIANRNLKYITPLFSYYDKDYLRLYIKVRHSKNECAKSIVKTGKILVCSQCPNHKVIPLGREALSWKGETIYVPNQVAPGTEKCDVCGSPNFMNGPIWIGPINDYDFVRNLNGKLNELDEEEARKKYPDFEKTRNLLSEALEEEEVKDVPLPISFWGIAKFLNMNNAPKKELIELGLKNQGYSIARSYMSDNWWKTNASGEVCLDLIKTWRKSVQEKNYLDSISKDSIQYKLLTKPIKYNPKFENVIDVKNDGEIIENERNIETIIDEAKGESVAFKAPVFMKSARQSVKAKSAK